MCSGDDNPPAAMDQRFPTARKEHRCCECKLPIPVGAKYVYTWGIWDGEHETFKQHIECNELLDFISENFCDGEAWSFGSLRDEVGEYSAELTGRFDAIKEKYRPAVSA